MGLTVARGSGDSAMQDFFWEKTQPALWLEEAIPVSMLFYVLWWWINALICRLYPRLKRENSVNNQAVLSESPIKKKTSQPLKQIEKLKVACQNSWNAFIPLENLPLPVNVLIY